VAAAQAAWLLALPLLLLLSRSMQCKECFKELLQQHCGWRSGQHLQQPMVVAGRRLRQATAAAAAAQLQGVRCLVESCGGTVSSCSGSTRLEPPNEFQGRAQHWPLQHQMTTLHFHALHGMA
jgi:hypothetical protein